MHGQFVWYELTTPDAEASKKFYPRFTGWGTQPFDQDYTMWTTGGVPFAGIFKLTDEMRQQGVPPNWMAYVEADDVDATVNKAKSLGATVMAGPSDIPNVGRYAVLTDPQGAAFGVYKSVRLDELARILEAPSAAEAVELIRRKVEERGPEDNYTAVLIRAHASGANDTTAEPATAAAKPLVPEVEKKAEAPVANREVVAAKPPAPAKEAPARTTAKAATDEATTPFPASPAAEAAVAEGVTAQAPQVPELPAVPAPAKP